MVAPVGAGIRDRLPAEVIRSPPEALGNAGLGAGKAEGICPHSEWEARGGAGEGAAAWGRGAGPAALLDPDLGGRGLHWPPGGPEKAQSERVLDGTLKAPAPWDWRPPASRRAALDPPPLFPGTP